jgi:small subunit ribosomal protein S16
MRLAIDRISNDIPTNHVRSIMLRIRLRRVGKKGRPYYRIIVADQRSPRDGAFVELLGHYDPMQDPPAITLDEEKAKAWMKKGAQPSDSVKQLLARRGIS